LFVLLLAGVAYALSQTLVIPALPQIARDLKAGQTATSWVLTGFLLSASIATPIVGKLGDLFGKGRVLTAILVMFSIGSVVNALAGSIEILIVGRVLQGAAAGVFPLAFGIVRDTFPPAKVPTGLGLISAIFGIGGGIGLPLSGVIVDHGDISWLFWIGLIGLPAALAAWRLIPPSAPVESTRIDWLGAGLLSLTLGSLLLGVTEGENLGWTSAGTVALIGGGVIFGIVWVVVEQRVAEPLIHLGVLRQRAVAATNLTGFLIGMSMFSSFLLIPQFAQTPESTGYGFGHSVTMSGLILLPSAVTQLVAGPVAGSLGGRIGFRATLAIGASLATSAFVLLAAAHAEPWEFIIAGVLLGAGISFAFASMANLIVAAVPQSEVGIATGINTVTRTVGGSFGSAIATAILAANLLPDSPLASEGAYTAAFVFSAVAGVLALGAALLIPRPPRQAEAPVGAPTPTAEPAAATT
jgi:EmrB/QacA subfamily drug resistance transporter